MERKYTYENAIIFVSRSSDQNQNIISATENFLKKVMIEKGEK